MTGREPFIAPYYFSGLLPFRSPLSSRTTFIQLLGHPRSSRYFPSPGISFFVSNPFLAAAVFSIVAGRQG